MMWWATCAECGQTFRDDQRFTVEPLLRIHEIEKHHEPKDLS